MTWKGDPNAVHDDVAAEIAALTEKATPVAADLILIEDSADSNSKKKAQVGNLPGGGGGGVLSMPTTILTRTSSPDSVAHNTEVTLTWQNEVRDDLDGWTSGSDITLPTTGRYLIVVQASFTDESTFDSGAANNRQIRIYVDGTRVRLVNQRAISSGGTILSAAVVVAANVNDVVQARVYQFSNETLNSPSSVPNRIEVVQLSGSAAPSGVSAARVKRTTNQTITTATITPVDWDTEDFDTDDYWEGVTNPDRLTAPTAGKYRVSAILQYGGSASGSLRQIRFHKNGTQFATHSTDPNGAAAAFSMAASTTVDLAAGDYVTVEAYQDSGGNLDLVSNTGNTLTASIERLSGTAFSGARVKLTADQTLTTGVAAAVSWDAEDFDTDDYWEGVTNPTRFTIPESGFYEIGAAIPFVGAADDEQRYVHFRKNGDGTNQYGPNRQASNAAEGSGAGGSQILQTSTLLELAAGDYVEVWVRQDSGGNLNIDGDQSLGSWICEAWIKKA